MVASGDWIVPHLDGLAYLQKPPLLYWMTAAYRVRRVREGTARWTPALAAVATVAVTCPGTGGGSARASGVPRACSPPPMVACW